MLSVILWCFLAVLALAMIILFFRLRIDHDVWKTKKDFSFDDLDKTLESQDYKTDVSKYLHKYKSDRRWYENRLAWEIVALIALMILFLADIFIIILMK
jgi:hypothetical protein